MRKVFLYTVSIIVLIFSLIVNPIQPLAAEQYSNIEEVYVYSADEEILLYDDSEGKKSILTISNDEKVEIVEMDSPYVLIRYADQKQKTWNGYIHEKFIVVDNTQSISEDNNTINNPPIDTDQIVEETKPIQPSNIKEPVNNDQLIQVNADSTKKELTNLTTSKNTVNSQSNIQLNSVGTTASITSKNVIETTSSTSNIKVTSTPLTGYAQKEPTNVYQSTSKSSKVLKSYRAGHLLKFRDYNSSWYIATVYINGVKHTGYIAKEDISDKITTLSGYAQLNSVYVYEKKSKSSKKLKGYRKGHLLKYRPHNASWYEATVYISGKPVKGYIYRSDVGHNPPLLQGYSQFEPIGVYVSTSKESSVLKTYRAGSKLKYRPYNNTWYRATVYISGKKHTGYIHKDDVGNSNPLLYGFPKKSKVSVYSSTSRKKALKSYSSGSILKYRPYNSSWYRATVYIKGKKHTGYIHRSDVITLTGKKIIIDAGHGGHDPGAVGNGLREKDINLDIAKRAKKLLDAAGFQTILTRSKDEFLTLQQRSSSANKLNADLFISIHVNSSTSSSASGIETYWYDKYEAANSERLAKLIQQEVIKETKTKNRGVKKGNFHVIRETKMPSVLLETGFISNKQDAQKLNSSTYKNQIVKGMVAAVKKFFNIL